MVQWDIPRMSTSVLLMTQLGVDRGVSEEVALRGTRIRAEQLLDPDAEVSAQQELRVIINLLDALGDAPGLGLEAGIRYHLTTYGIYGFALISSPSLRSAIDVGLRYLDLTFALTRIRARADDDEMQLALDAPDVPLSVRRFVVERDAAAVQTVQRELFAAAIPLRRVSFAFPAPDAVGRYEDIFGVGPEFDAPETLLAFEPTLLDVPLPQANLHTAVLAQAQCRDLLARQRARTGLAGEVRDLILASPSSPPDADQIAARLHLRPRTLRHRLANEGTSYRVLLEEVRERLAEELLLGGLTVSEVAQRLGYVELSSFSQAFRRWKGVGPREYCSRLPARRRVRS